MNLLARAERDVLTRAIVAFVLIVAILVLGLLSASAAPRLITCNDRGCFETKSAKRAKSAESSWSFGSGDLVSRARRHLGTNPTGWRKLWCGRFMAMIAPHAAAQIRNP